MLVRSFYLGGDILKGIGISDGIGLGKVFVYREDALNFSRENITDIDIELDRLDNSIKETKVEIDKIYDLSLKNFNEKESHIFIAHRMLLEDPEYIGGIKKKIKEEKINSEWAVMEVTKSYISLFENMKDLYIKERAIDLKDVSNRLLRSLLDIENHDFSKINEEIIIVAQDLKPSDFVQINLDMVVGIVTEIGGETSHTGIMARTMNIPGVSGIKNITKKVKDGDFIIIEGSSGQVMIDPSLEDINIHRLKQEKLEEEKKALKDMIGMESISQDGYRVRIYGNIGTINDVDDVIKNDGEGVGLYRTEFLYMNSGRLPREEDQFAAYKIAAERLKGKPLAIRTLDVGGDKEIPYLNIPQEMNPFLGYRAIRFCLDNRDIFKTQLRAILRASVYGNIKIMFPMISSLEELRLSKSILNEVKDELRNKKIDFKEDIEIGIMVEIPSVAIQSRAFAKEVDFFSIGTNDLIQYTLAVDRGNQEIAHLYNPFNPAVLSLIRMTIENGHEEGISVGMCGEAAGNMKLIPLFLAMGLDDFSMSPSSILKARQLIRNINKGKIKSMLDEILDLGTAGEIEEYLDSLSF